ncbi:MAG: dolichyl-phosphate beta-glucosyltransferase [Candidatus Paceibacterota bacterium]
MISVIIPVYNEEKRIPRTLDGLFSFLKTNGIEAEVILVNDGSSDNTVKCLKTVTLSNLKIINFAKNKGKGAAVREGALSAIGEIIIFMDADGSTRLEHITEVINFLNTGYDVAIGSRELKESKIIKKQSSFRELLGKTFSIMVKTIGLSHITDTQCGFKGFKKEAAKEIFEISKINRFAFDVEILYIANKLGCKIKEIPVKWENDENSKVDLKNIIIMFFDIIKIRFNLSTNKYGKKNSKRIS